MWYTIAFIGGAAIGVISMALFAASTMDSRARQNLSLTEAIDETEQELERYREALGNAPLSQKDMDELQEVVEMTG